METEHHMQLALVGRRSCSFQFYTRWHRYAGKRVKRELSCFWWFTNVVQKAWPKTFGWLNLTLREKHFQKMELW